VLFGAPLILNANTDVSIEVKEVTGYLGLYNTITVEVDNLTEYLEQSGRDAKKFILYLDWRQLKGVKSRLIEGTDKLKFDIRRTSNSKDEWNALLGRPKGFTCLVPVSIGYENEKPIPSDVKHSLIVIKKGWFWVFVISFVVLFFFFMYLARKTCIIRNPSPEDPSKRPYSLGRTQMAFWFFIVLVSYVFIWMITSELESLTESALGLIGISSATALGATVVGSSKRRNTESKLQSLEKEKAVLDKELEELRTGSTLTEGDLIREAEKDTRLNQVERDIIALREAKAPELSDDFFTDILNDADGISLHRFQIFIWTIVLGFIFLIKVYNSLAMPEFGGTLLALMGISGGTYIGFKFPEKKN
jgi:hypothetical protein